MNAAAKPNLQIFAPPDSGGQQPPKKKSKKPRLPKFLTSEQAEQLVACAHDQLEREKAGRGYRRPQPSRIQAAERDLFVVQFFLNTGLRLQELIDLDVGAVDLNRQQVYVEHGKGDKERYVPLDDDFIPTIRDWIGSRTAGPLIHRDDGRPLSEVTTYWRVVRLGRKAKMPFAIHPHTLRHTYATVVYEATGDIRLVQQLLGHESIATTQIYAHCTAARMLSAVNVSMKRRRADRFPKSP